MTSQRICSRTSQTPRVNMKVLLLFLITKTLALNIQSNRPSFAEIKRNHDVIHISRTTNDHNLPDKAYNTKKNEVYGYNQNIVTNNNLTIKIDEPKYVDNMAGTPCCNGVSCFPCPYPMPMAYPVPVPQVPQIPIVVPAQTFYEPVIHDHPPLHEIKRIMKRKRRKRPRYSDSDSSDSSDADDGYSSIDYYDDAFHIKA